MIVLSLTNCPNSLRGDLTRWLFEVDTNLYVGKQSARIREKIWERVITYTKSGRAVMVYPTNNEQGFDFRIWGATWEPIDYDGLKLMLRPHPGVLQTNKNKLMPGSSKVEKRLAAKRFAKSRKKTLALPDTYLVVDVETTGLSAETDEIIEIGSIKVVERESTDTFQAFIRTEVVVPEQISRLTGITNETILREGRNLEEVIRDYRKFAGSLPIVSHNSVFDMSFLRKAYEKCGYSLPTNLYIDTLRMARKFLNDAPDYKLGTLAEYFHIEQIDLHRGLTDCEVTKQLFEKLRIISVGGIVPHEEAPEKVNENDEAE